MTGRSIGGRCALYLVAAIISCCWPQWGNAAQTGLLGRPASSAGNAGPAVEQAIIAMFYGFGVITKTILPVDKYGQCPGDDALSLLFSQSDGRLDYALYLSAGPYRNLGGKSFFLNWKISCSNGGYPQNASHLAIGSSATFVFDQHNCVQQRADFKAFNLSRGDGDLRTLLPAGHISCGFAILFREARQFTEGSDLLLLDFNKPILLSGIDLDLNQLLGHQPELLANLFVRVVQCIPLPIGKPCDSNGRNGCQCGARIAQSISDTQREPAYSSDGSHEYSEANGPDHDKSHANWPKIPFWAGTALFLMGGILALAAFGHGNPLVLIIGIALCALAIKITTVRDPVISTPRYMERYSRVSTGARFHLTPPRPILGRQGKPRRTWPGMSPA